MKSCTACNCFVACCISKEMQLMQQTTTFYHFDATNAQQDATKNTKGNNND